MLWWCLWLLSIYYRATKIAFTALQKKATSEKKPKSQVWSDVHSLSVKGLKVSVSCRRGVEDGPPLLCSPSVQRSWGSGVSRERLCDVTGLLWLGWPAVLSPSIQSLSLGRPRCCPVKQSPFVTDRPVCHVSERAWYSTVNRDGSFKTCLHPGSILLVVLRQHHHFQHPADIQRVSDINYVSPTYK